MNNQKNPNNFTPRTANSSKPKTKRKANKDGIITLCFIALIAIIIVVLIVLLVKAIANKPPVETSENTTTIETSATDATTSITTDNTYITSTTQPIIIPDEGYYAYNIKTSDYKKGCLAIINSNTPFAGNPQAGLISLYNQDGFATVYRLRNTHVSLQASIIEDFTKMMSDLKNSSASSLTPGDVYLIKYAAAPTDPWRVTDAEDENIAGWSFDLRVLLSGSKLEAPLSDTEAQWIRTNGSKYGFVLRYDEGKESFTHEDFDNSHIRYVGKINAEYMNLRGYCLEEYIDILKNTTSYNTPAQFNGYHIYFVAANVDDENTMIQVKNGHEIISTYGDNQSGFVVITKAK